MPDNDQNDQPEAVSVAQAAFMLGVSQATIRREIEAGVLTVFRVRGSIRIPYASIHKLVNSATGKESA